MAGGAFIGGWGLTQQDVLDIEAACDVYADPVQVYVPRAARGQIGWVKLKTVGPWGIPMRVTPMAAFSLFFDLPALIELVATTVPKLAAASSLAEAEEIFEREFGSPPETRLIKVARLRRGRDADRVSALDEPVPRGRTCATSPGTRILAPRCSAASFGTNGSPRAPWPSGSGPVGRRFARCSSSSRSRASSSRSASAATA